MLSCNKLRALKVFRLNDFINCHFEKTMLSGTAGHKTSLKTKSYNLILAVSYQGYNKLQYTLYTNC